MAGFSKEKRERLQALAQGSFLQSSDPNVDAFLKRMEAENAPVFADVYAGDMTFFNAPRRNEQADVDLACIGIPFERDMLRQRTNAGLAAARKRGRVGGRPKRIDAVALKKARALLASGDYSKGQVADELGVSRHTLWRALEEAEKL